MELTCSAAGSCMGKLFENWYPAYCSSHCYNYFFVSLEAYCVTQEKREGAEFSFIKKKILLCLGSVNQLFYTTSIFLLLLMHNYFLGEGEVVFLPPPLILGWEHDTNTIYFIFLGQSDAQMTYGEWIVNLLKPISPAYSYSLALLHSVALSTTQCHAFPFVYCLSSPLEWRYHFGRDLVCPMHPLRLGPRTVPGTLQALQ